MNLLMEMKFVHRLSRENLPPKLQKLMENH